MWPDVREGTFCHLVHESGPSCLWQWLVGIRKWSLEAWNKGLKTVTSCFLPKLLQKLFFVRLKQTSESQSVSFVKLFRKTKLSIRIEPKSSRFAELKKFPKIFAAVKLLFSRQNRKIFIPGCICRPLNFEIWRQTPPAWPMKGFWFQRLPIKRRHARRRLLDVDILDVDVDKHRCYYSL